MNYEFLKKSFKYHEQFLIDTYFKYNADKVFDFNEYLNDENCYKNNVHYRNSDYIMLPCGGNRISKKIDINTKYNIYKNDLISFYECHHLYSQEEFNFIVPVVVYLDNECNLEIVYSNYRAHGICCNQCYLIRPHWEFSQELRAASKLIAKLLELIK